MLCVAVVVLSWRCARVSCGEMPWSVMVVTGNGFSVSCPSLSCRFDLSSSALCCLGPVVCRGLTVTSVHVLVPSTYRWRTTPQSGPVSPQLPQLCHRHGTGLLHMLAHAAEHGYFVKRSHAVLNVGVTNGRLKHRRAPLSSGSNLQI